VRSPHLIHELLEDAAASRGDHAAVVDGSRICSYSELERRANQIAHALLSVGVSAGDRVGLYLDKSVEAVAGIYGILKTGAAYVPLDLRAPSPRLGYIARNCGLRCLLTGGAKASRWPAIAADGGRFEHVILLTPQHAEEVDGHPERVKVLGFDEVAGCSSRRPACPPNKDLAYILYTSGSTGVPKGVMLSHENALAFVDWAVRAVGVTSDDRLSSHAPLHFDLSIFDLYAAAATASTLVLVPPQASVLPVELARFIRTAGITVWYSVPTVLSMLVDRGGLARGDFPRLRVVNFAGEVFPTRYLAGLMRLLPSATFWNFYGPTETNVCTAYHVPEPPDPDGGDIPIGKPIEGVRAYVMTDEGSYASLGQEGELLIGGPTVMQGYWADEEKTAQKLVPDPRDERRLVYRTGDLVAEQPDGNLRFLGRIDNQIKSRGYRIELGEIETVLHSHPGVIECAVAAVPDDLVTNRLLAHVVVCDGTSVADLARFCRDRLPSYMAPEHYRSWDTLPRTSTGKIDRQSLREVGDERSTNHAPG
jgi:amino acid adenylation domain-containing protein